MGKLTVTHMGEAGVNVDKSPLELDDNELVQSQNAVSDGARGTGSAGTAALRKRPGFIAFNTAAITAGSVLGGADLPTRNTTNAGIRSLYIGRGPTV